VGDSMYRALDVSFYFQYAELCLDGSGFAKVDEAGQADLADRTEKWARLIEDEWRFLEYGEPIEWLEEGRRVCRLRSNQKAWFTSEVYRPKDYTIYRLDADRPTSA
jgi:hypothetical protein